MKKRIYLYDTTLRDGQQTRGVDFSVEDKYRVTQLLDTLGVDHIEGGWPGANPTDSEYFANPPKINASLTAFGMTKRTGRSVENDDVLAAVVNAGTPSICLVGKSHDFHVTEALGITLDENLDAIRDSIGHVVKQNREALFDAEHFFDGYDANPEYAMQTVKAAHDAGARWIVLCDTNGGVMPDRAAKIVRDVIDAGIPGDHIGIHAHNDTEQAVAVSLAAIEAGACQIQGTLNGLGERCGNANLTTLIASLKTKPDLAERFETGVTDDALGQLTATSRALDAILNREPNAHAAYVGASAFAHKSGLHASAILKNPMTYEHIMPETVGNTRIIPMSNQAGLSNLRQRLSDAGIEIANDDPRLAEILREVKAREERGFAFDSAAASFELMARRVLGILPEFFEVKRYRVNIERRKNKHNEMTSLAEAVVVVKVDGEKRLAVSEGLDETGSNRGPVHALWKALVKDMGRLQPYVDTIQLVDFKVRIYGSGTDAVTRVMIVSQDDKGREWSTVGVSPNLVDASFDALLDAVRWKLVADGIAA